MTFNFNRDANNNPILSGGLGIVATNYIDLFTKFTYYGGSGAGMSQVQDMITLKGESVAGYGLYIKSLFDGTNVEKRRVTCEGCTDESNYPIGEGTNTSLNTAEWTYIGFHDDARIHTNNQKTLIEAPVVEFFGHAEIDAFSGRGGNTNISIKADSLIFHDRAIFAGQNIEFLTYVTGTPRDLDMRYGVINYRGVSLNNYLQYGTAISMTDRNTPFFEFGYQRCN